MQEKELDEILKSGIKSPSINFTDNIMSEISKLESTEKNYHFPLRKGLIIASCIVVAILSIFVKLPNVHLSDKIIEIPSFTMPIICLVMFIIVAQIFYDTDKIEEQTQV
ncbi:MAG: hypothetical protein ACK5IQ_07765 [Bacteroidales bacterium]